VSGTDEYEIMRLVEIDSAVVADLTVLAQQLKPAWEALTESSVEALVASESRVYVARCDSRIVGITVMVPHRHLPGLSYHVEDVVIATEHRGRGVGRRLLEYSMQDVPGPAVSFDLRSHASRTAAHRLYSSLGFRPSDTTLFRLDVDRGCDHGAGRWV
jgi:phosphinothricin acetyltransferase